jgi:hypothetical protein
LRHIPFEKDYLMDEPKKPRYKPMSNGVEAKVNNVADLRLAATQEHAALMNKIREANEQIQIHNQNIQVWGTRALKLDGMIEGYDMLEPPTEA